MFSRILFQYFDNEKKIMRTLFCMDLTHVIDDVFLITEYILILNL